MRKFVSVFVVACLAVVGSVSTGHAAGGTIYDEGFQLDPNLPQDKIGRQAVALMDRADQLEIASVLRGYPVSGRGAFRDCDGLSSRNCTAVESITFNAILQKCASPTDMNCITEFGVIAADGSKIAASFDRKFPSTAFNAFTGDVNKSLPEGGPGSLWTLPPSAGLSTPLHYVRASVQGSAAPGAKFVFTGFTAGITPVSMTTRVCERTQTWTLDNPCTPGDYPCIQNCEIYGADTYWGSVENFGNPDEKDCIMTGNADWTARTADCAARKPPSTNVKYYLTVRLSQSPQGWLHGRLAEPDISITEVAGGIELAMSGKPIHVPVVFKEQAYADLPAPLKEKYARDGGWPSSVGGSSYFRNWGLPDTDLSNGTKRNRISGPPSYGPDGIDELNAWMPYLNDTSTADRSTWSVRTLSTWERGQANSCIADKTRVTGLVVTNATQYKAGAPELNKTSGALEYKVAAPHFMSSGEVFKGVYQLIMRSDVARCIYGFTNAPIQATVDVIEENGATSTAVTSVSEANGWLRLSAVGFTHSSPTIRAKLTQETAVSAPESSSPAVTTPPARTTPSNTPAATIAPATTTRPTMKVKGTLTAKSLAVTAGLKVAAGARVTVSVSATSRKVCQVSAGKVKALKKGTCKVSVSVVAGKKKTSRSVSLTVA